jgi:hypothetical protein
MSLVARFRLATVGASPTRSVRRLRARIEGDDRLTLHAVEEAVVVDGRFPDSNTLAEAASALLADPAVDAAGSAVELQMAAVAGLSRPTRIG